MAVTSKTQAKKTPAKKTSTKKAPAKKALAKKTSATKSIGKKVAGSKAASTEKVKVGKAKAKPEVAKKSAKPSAKKTAKKSAKATKAKTVKKTTKKVLDSKALNTDEVVAKIDFGFIGSREETAEARNVKSRTRVRTQLESDVELFLKQGGKINSIEANVMADPPRKPESNYGSRPI